jgi:hypothetical protein
MTAGYAMRRLAKGLLGLALFLTGCSNGESSEDASTCYESSTEFPYSSADN